MGFLTAFAHHDTPHCDQRSRSKAKLFCTKQASNRNVSPRAQLTISLHDHATTKIVEHKSLMSFSETELPWQASVLDTSPAGGTGTAIVAGDQEMVGLGLRHTGRDDTDTSLGHQLDGNARTRVGALQVVDELLQILNRVDVVVRGRRDETDAGRGVPRTRNRLRDLVAWQLTTLTRLGALRHFDLELVGVRKIVAGDTEAARSNLLDGGTHRVAVLERQTALRVLATLAGVRFATKPIHGNGKRGV